MEGEWGRKGRTGADAGCLDHSALRSSYPVTWLLWVCSGPRVSQHSECVWFSLVKQTLGSCVFLFLVTVLHVCLAPMALVWAGQTWFFAV